MWEPSFGRCWRKIKRRSRFAPIIAAGQSASLFVHNVRVDVAVHHLNSILSLIQQLLSIGFGHVHEVDKVRTATLLFPFRESLAQGSKIPPSFLADH